MNYVLSPQAKDDLVEIYDRSLDDWGDEQADRYLAGLYATFDSAGISPFAGWARPEIGEDVRSRLFGSHVVFYANRSGRVEILRIFHQSRDLGAVFDGL